MIHPISKNLLQPVFKTNAFFVNSIEEFEELKLEPNESKIAFDNFKQCIYMRERNRFGEYSDVKIFFYEDFSQKIQSIEREEFITRCKKIGYKAEKIEIACKLFVDGCSNQDVCNWLWEAKGEMIEYDSMKTKKSRMKKELYPELAKSVNKK